MRYRRRFRLKPHTAITIDALQHTQRQRHNASWSTKHSAARLDRNLTGSPTHRPHDTAESDFTAKLSQPIREIDRQLRIAAAHMPRAVTLDGLLSLLLQPQRSAR